MDLSIIIVSWNVREKLKSNLITLYQNQGSISFEVFVVDNNSADRTAGMVKKEFPQVELIANQENLGFAKANNQAIKQSFDNAQDRAKGDFILLLNPDMRVMPGTLEKMVKWMRENKQAAVAGCHLIDEQGNTIKHVRRFPTVWNQLAIVLKLPHIFPSVLNKYLWDDFNYSKAQKVDSVRGGFFLIRQETVKKIGILDERYFLWFEEVDFCWRVEQKGGEVWYTPVAKCVDYVGQSFKQLLRGQAQKYFRDSQLKYFKKWHSWWECLLLKLAWPIGMLLTWIGNRVKFKVKART